MLVKFVEDDNASNVVSVDQINVDGNKKVFATVKCWVQVKIDGKFYSGYQYFVTELSPTGV